MQLTCPAKICNVSICLVWVGPLSQFHNEGVHQGYVTPSKSLALPLKTTLLSLLCPYPSLTCALSPQISDPKQELTVTHMFYTAWPDHGVPRNAMSLISFIRRVRKEHPTSLATPLLVHCSAGVGRTGTFILLDLTMQQMKGEGTLSVFQRLKSMRTQRMKLVQTQVSCMMQC